MDGLRREKGVGIGGKSGWVLGLTLLAGCTFYQPEPLVSMPTWPRELPRLQVDPKSLPFPELAAHPFDPRDGLDMTEVATLAVVNNPDLKLVRDDLGIARAQAFDAGLLPDPQFYYSPQIPETNTPGENVIAFDVGLNYDLSALVLHHARQAAADAEAHKADLALLWQEWQVVGQARLLFVRIRAEEDLRATLQESRQVAAQLQRREEGALAQGNLTVTVLSADATTLQGIERQISDTELVLSQNRMALNALLGLAPETVLNLVGETNVPIPDAAEVRAQLPTLPQRRPDLRALAAGYEAQDQRLWQAILGQFPAINFGLLKARDNNGTNYHGYAVSTNLPILNRNRGVIAIEKATRQRLHDEYQLRINTAQQEIAQLLSDLTQLEHTLRSLDENLALQTRVARQSTLALQAGTLDLSANALVQEAHLTKLTEKITLEQAIREERVALETLVGGEFSGKEMK